MNILVLTPFLPCLGKHGGSAQMFNLWSEMQDIEGLHIQLLSYQTEMEEGRSESTSNVFDNIDIIPTKTPEQWLLDGYLTKNISENLELPFLLEAYKRRLIELLKNESWDVVIIEMQFMMHFGELVRKYSSSKVGLVVHESMEQRYKKDSLMLQDFLNYERCYEQYIDFLVCFSEEDKESIEHYNKPTYTLPLCVDIGNFVSAKRNSGEIIFLGSYNHQPNVDAVDFLLSDIMPLVKSPYCLKIYGAQLNNNLIKRWQCYPNVELVGFVENALLAMAQCSVFIAPIISGKGVRTKIVEALSQNTPVVTTSLGVEGIDVVDGVDILIADAPIKFSAAIDSILKNNVSIGDNAVEKVSEHSADNVAKIMYGILIQSSKLAL